MLVLFSHYAVSNAVVSPLDCSPAGFSVRGILQARILERVAISFSKGSSPSKDQTCASCLVGRFFTAEPPEKPMCEVGLHQTIDLCHFPAERGKQGRGPPCTLQGGWGKELGCCATRRCLIACHFFILWASATDSSKQENISLTSHFLHMK